jgi:hypothetical protein
MAPALRERSHQDLSGDNKPTKMISVHDLQLDEAL